MKVLIENKWKPCKYISGLITTLSFNYTCSFLFESKYWFYCLFSRFRDQFLANFWPTRAWWKTKLYNLLILIYIFEVKSNINRFQDIIIPKGEDNSWLCNYWDLRHPNSLPFSQLIFWIFLTFSTKIGPTGDHFL